jgi:hypothetical protein
VRFFTRRKDTRMTTTDTAPEPDAVGADTIPRPSFLPDHPDGAEHAEDIADAADTPGSDTAASVVADDARHLAIIMKRITQLSPAGLAYLRATLG